MKKDEILEPLPKGTDLNDLPSGVYKPRPVGEWITTPYPENDKITNYTCPICRKSFSYSSSTESKPNFCLDCGARLGADTRGEA